MNKFFYMALCSAFILIGCKPTPNHNQDVVSEEAHNHEHGENVISLPQDKALAAGVQSTIIKAAPFHGVIKTGGKILSALGDESIVVATIPGVVSLPQNLVEGLTIQNGQNIASLSSQSLQDGDPTQRAQINYDIAKKEYERVLPLIESKIITQKEFARIKQEYENARISYEANSKGHTANGQIIKSPLTGYVKSIYVKEGDFVTVGQPLMSLTKNKRLYLRAEVSERYYSQLKNIVSANFKSSYQEQVYKLEDLQGSIISYGKSPSEDSYLLPITFAFNNIGDIVPNSFVEVFLLSKTQENAISLPYSAITEEQGLFFAYKQVCKEEYEKVEVKLGNDNGECVQILSGINEGDLIVTKGAQQLKLASASNSIPAHTHDH